MAQDTGTPYYGDAACVACGAPLNPVQAVFNRGGLCAPCRRSQDARLVKNRMVR